MKEISKIIKKMVVVKKLSQMEPNIKANIKTI
jgi:hypothetical protein